jgi:hypothetical protein
VRLQQSPVEALPASALPALAPSGGAHIGLALDVVPDGAGTAYGKPGATDGYHCEIEFSVDRGVGVVLLTNSGGLPTAGMIPRLYEAAVSVLAP